MNRYDGYVEIEYAAVFLSFLQWGKGRKLSASKKQGQHKTAPTDFRIILPF